MYFLRKIRKKLKYIWTNDKKYSKIKSTVKQSDFTGRQKMVLKTNNELGEIFVANNVVAEISGAVAAKCYGVVGMATRSKKDGIVNLLRHDSMTKGIGVSVDNSGVVIELHIIVEYGMNITSVCKSIVNRVRYTVESSLGLKVNRVDVRVEGVRTDA